MVNTNLISVMGEVMGEYRVGLATTLQILATSDDVANLHGHSATFFCIVPYLKLNFRKTCYYNTVLV